MRLNVSFLALAIAIAAQAAPALRDTQGRVIEQSFFSKPTIVLVVDKKTIHELSSQIEKFKAEYSVSEQDRANGARALDEFQFLMLWDGRADFLENFYSDPKVKKLTARGLRARIGLRKAGEALAEGDAEMRRRVTAELQKELGALISPNRIRTAALFASSDDHYPYVSNLKLQLGFNNNGPSAKALRYFFGSAQPSLRAAVLDKRGYTVHHWAGSLDAVSIANRYFEEVELGTPRQQQLQVQTQVDPQRQPSSEIKRDLKIFDRITESAKKQDRPDMAPVLKVFHDYTANLGVCRKEKGFPSSEVFRDYLFQVFMKVEERVNALLTAGLTDFMYYKIHVEFRNYIKTATTLGRLYLRAQAKRFNKSEADLAASEAALYQASYDIYKQVSEITRLHSEIIPFDKLEADTTGRSAEEIIASYETINKIKDDDNDGKVDNDWSRILDAIAKVESEDTDHCGDLMAQQSPTIPHAKERSDVTHTR